MWPRGVTKEAAKLDAWTKGIAPSDALRKWFAHDRKKWDAFRERYLKELEAHHAALEDLAARAKRRRVTLLFGARDEECNQAVVIRDYLRRGFRSHGQGT